jgi:hypothetical protein
LFRDGPPSPGPLAPDESGSIGITAWEHPGDFGFGHPIVVNTGDKPAILKRIRLIAPSAGLEVIAAQVAGSTRKFVGTSYTHEWPSPSSTRRRALGVPRIGTAPREFDGPPPA